MLGKRLDQAGDKFLYSLIEFGEVFLVLVLFYKHLTFKTPQMIFQFFVSRVFEFGLAAK